jgi:signal peptidase I
MVPAVGQGDAVVVEPVAATAIAVDDIVSLRVQPAGTLFTHRVIRITERDGEPWFETKGDANPAPDPSLVPADWIVGRVSAIVPTIGYLIALLSIPSGVIFVLGIGTTLLVLAWLLETLEIRAAARRVAGGPVGSGWPAMPPSTGRAERLVHALVDAGRAGVYRMVPDRRRPAWRRASATRPGKAG